MSWTWNGQDFTILNVGPGYVSEVYFDLAPGMSATFLSGVGTVSFTVGANPPALPGGNVVGFISDAAFDSDTSGGTAFGIDPGESATFRILGGSLDSFATGAIAAGVHERSLTDASASVVNIPGVNAAPEPATLGLLGVGLAGLGFSRRRKH